MRTIITMLVMLFAACNLSAQYTIRIDPGQQGKRGALPPVWLKNKLTDGQYDSLAMLAKHYAVDYSFFKQRNLDEKRIQKYFTRVGKILKDRGRLARADATPIRDKIAISCMLREIHEFSSHAIRHGLYIKNRKRLFCP